MSVFKANIFVNLLLSYSINAAKITKLRKWHAISQSLNKTNLKIFQLSIICKGRQSSYYLFRIYFAASDQIENQATQTKFANYKSFDLSFLNANK